MYPKDTHPFVVFLILNINISGELVRSLTGGPPVADIAVVRCLPSAITESASSTSRTTLVIAESCQGQNLMGTET